MDMLEDLWTKVQMDDTQNNFIRKGCGITKSNQVAAAMAIEGPGSMEEAPWICKLCNEVFNNGTDYQEHWQAELELLDGPWAECSFQVPAQRTSGLLPEVVPKVSSGGDPPGKQFRNCFELADEGRRGKAEKRAVRFEDKVLVLGETKRRCPLCDKLLPLAELQEHVEEELETMNKVPPQKAEVKPVSKGLLVLGDDPRPRKRRKPSQTESGRAVLAFNHYADGNGWWSEDMVGTGAAEVGCQMSWEGLGSVHFED